MQMFVNAAFLDHRMTGVQRHAWEILSRLRAAEFPLTLLAPPTLQVAPSYAPTLQADLKRVGFGAGNLWQQISLPQTLQANQLLWTPGGLPPLLARRHIITFHDISVFDHPEWFSRSYYLAYRMIVPLALRHAVHVFTSSQHSRERIVARIGVDRARITVVPSAATSQTGPADELSIRRVRTHYKLPERYILAVGSIEPRKNLSRLCEAVTQLFQHDPSFRLVLVGGRHNIYGDVTMPTAAREAFLPLGYVPDEDLGAIYAGARVFVYPSLYEGFGIPPLEAMAYGVPVITSYTTSLPEAVGSAALLVNPLDVTQIAFAIKQVWHDDTICRQLVAAGRQQVQAFSWERSTAIVQAVLRDLMSG